MSGSCNYQTRSDNKKKSTHLFTNYLDKMRVFHLENKTIQECAPGASCTEFMFLKGLSSLQKENLLQYQRKQSTMKKAINKILQKVQVKQPELNARNF